MTEHGDIVEVSYSPDEEEEEKVTDEDHAEEDEHQLKDSAKKKPHHSHAAKKIQKKIKELLDSLEKVTAERDELKDKYLRSLAEMDNFRKRVKKEKEEFQKYVMADFFLGLLEVVDNLERALKARVAAEIQTNHSGANNEKSIISGIEMIHKQLLDLLRKNGVEEIDALGRTFDPNIHQALSKEEREGITSPVVLEVYQKGFMYNGKLLRPTLTKVAMPREEKAAKAEEPAETGENDDEGENQ
jgi:molecular chaperone GrpE